MTRARWPKYRLSLTEQEREWLEELARRAGVPYSTLLRRWIYEAAGGILVYPASEK